MCAIDDPHAAETENLFHAIAAAENGSGGVRNFARRGCRRRRDTLARGTLAFPGHPPTIVFADVRDRGGLLTSPASGISVRPLFRCHEITGRRKRDQTKSGAVFRNLPNPGAPLPGGGPRVSRRLFDLRPGGEGVGDGPRLHRGRGRSFGGLLQPGRSRISEAFQRAGRGLAALQGEGGVRRGQPVSRNVLRRRGSEQIDLLPPDVLRGAAADVERQLRRGRVRSLRPGLPLGGR